jgi:hypothetical protein
MWFGDPTQFTGPKINNKSKQSILHIVTFNINFYNIKKKQYVGYTTDSAGQMENTLILCYENKVLHTLDSHTKMKKITSQWQHQEH